MDSTHTVAGLLANSESTIHLDNSSTTAQQLAADGTYVAAHLRDLGLRHGDRVAVWAPNSLGYLRLLAAAAVGRFVLVSVNTRFSLDEAASIVNRSGALVVVTSRPEDLDASGLTDCQIIPIARFSDETSDLQLGGDTPNLHLTDHSHQQSQPDDPFVVFTTSGTTSQPKLVLHTQRSIHDHARDVAGLFGYTSSARTLVALPLCGVFGLASLAAPLAGGSTVWLPSQFDAETTASDIERHRITIMHGPDDMFHRMMATERDLSSIKLAGYARFNPSLGDIVDRAAARGITLTGLYGMSEVQALFMLQDPTSAPSERSMGGGALVSRHAGARVVDPASGEEQPVGEAGELQLHGPSLFVGYLQHGGAGINLDLTESAFVTDAEGVRWFTTGDLAQYEPNGTISYLTRMGDVLRLGGFLVSPAEIEEVLVGHPSIGEAQVVTVARPEGVRPVAVVIAASDGSAHTEIDQGDVISYCTERLAQFKVPIAVLKVDEFPVALSANGTKIQRNVLQTLAADALGGT